MTRIEDVLGRMTAAMIDASRRHVVVTLGASLLLTGVSLYVAATQLEVDTDSDRLLADHRHQLLHPRIFEPPRNREPGPDAMCGRDADARLERNRAARDPDMGRRGREIE